MKQIFNPEEIIFVPTQECNLRCAHCFVPKTANKLNLEKSLAFLNDAIDDGIMRVGFSGGEPFLALDFVCAVVQKTVEAGAYFDRLMTNAVAFKDSSEMKNALNRLFDAGFDGVFGISFDAFHAQKVEKIADFIKEVESIWQERNHVSLICTKKASANAKTLEMLKELAAKLDLRFDYDEADCEGEPERGYGGASDFPSALVYKDKLETFMNDGLEFDSIPVETIDFIAENPEDESAWQSDGWFTEDYCAGPGHVYYVHADGNVAACCGYANECDALILGNINSMTYEQIAENAQASCKSGFLSTVYKIGLLKEAKKLEKQGHKFPGKGRTSDNCLFCRYLLQKVKAEE
ncbi:MAG: 4Fe-4S cluster-binding domain-containing protein [Spirochaetaceae bacterium]|nr:4Fe-4S cluster-binding domain-containing protein [Spirochaetaceae bacterium]